jgi:phosphatase and actin regulator 4
LKKNYVEKKGRKEREVKQVMEKDEDKFTFGEEKPEEMKEVRTDKSNRATMENIFSDFANHEAEKAMGTKPVDGTPSKFERLANAQNESEIRRSVSDLINRGEYEEAIRQSAGLGIDGFLDNTWEDVKWHRAGVIMEALMKKVPSDLTYSDPTALAFDILENYKPARREPREARIETVTENLENERKTVQKALNGLALAQTTDDYVLRVNRIRDLVNQNNALKTEFGGILNGRIDTRINNLAKSGNEVDLTSAIGLAKRLGRTEMATQLELRTRTIKKKPDVIEIDDDDDNDVEIVGVTKTVQPLGTKRGEPEKREDEEKLPEPQVKRAMTQEDLFAQYMRVHEERRVNDEKEARESRERYEKEQRESRERYEKEQQAARERRERYEKEQREAMELIMKQTGSVSKKK